MYIYVSTYIQRERERQREREIQRMATAAAFLMTVACMRDVEVVFENPPCSTIWKFPVVKQVLDFFVLRSTCTPRCAWSREPWGKRMLKKYKFACTGMWISRIHRPCRCPGRRHLRLTRNVWINGKLKFTGRRRELKSSAAYPNALGKAIVNSMVYLYGNSDALPQQELRFSHTDYACWMQIP